MTVCEIDSSAMDVDGNEVGNPVNIVNPADHVCGLGDVCCTVMSLSPLESHKHSIRHCSRSV